MKACSPTTPLRLRLMGIIVYNHVWICKGWYSLIYSGVRLSGLVSGSCSIKRTRINTLDKYFSCKNLADDFEVYNKRRKQEFVDENNPVGPKEEVCYRDMMGIILYCIEACCLFQCNTPYTCTVKPVLWWVTTYAEWLIGLFVLMEKTMVINLYSFRNTYRWS